MLVAALFRPASALHRDESRLEMTKLDGGGGRWTKCEEEQEVITPGHLSLKDLGWVSWLKTHTY